MRHKMWNLSRLNPKKERDERGKRVQISFFVWTKPFRDFPSANAAASAAADTFLAGRFLSDEEEEAEEAEEEEAEVSGIRIKMATAAAWPNQNISP